MGLGKVGGRRGCIIKINFMYVWKSQRIKARNLDACGGAGCSNPEYRSQAPSGSWQSQAPEVLCEQMSTLANHIILSSLHCAAQDMAGKLFVSLRNTERFLLLCFFSVAR